MNINSITQYLNNLNENQKQRFQKYLLMLFEQEFNTLSLRGPYKLVLDSNIIMRIEDVEKVVISEIALAVLCFFDYFKAQNHYQADLIIYPSVFYEFCKHQTFGSLVDHWQKFKTLRDLLEKILDFKILFEKVSNFNDAQYYFNLIEDDATIIKSKLIEVSSKDWRFDFVRRPGGVKGFIRNDLNFEVPPLFAAENLYEDIVTNYFDSYCVGLFLKDHIAFMLANNPENDITIASKYKSPQGYNLRKVLYINQKGSLRGLADIEIFSLCNIREQFYRQAHGEYWPASISLTVDENLFLGLKKYSNCNISSEPLLGGEPENSVQTKLDIFFDDIRRRMVDAENRQKSCLKAQVQYLQNIKYLFRGSEKV
jgi:hypothetical protein